MKKTLPYLVGSTIVEVLISLAIASFCTSLAVIIFLNVQKSSLPFFKLKALELAEYYTTKTIQQRTFYEETYKSEEFTVKKFVSRHEMFGDCYRLRMIVFDPAHKKILELETSAYNNE